MTETSQKLLDPIGLGIIDELQRNARLPFTELGRRVGLSTPAVMERVRRLEEANIILDIGQGSIPHSLAMQFTPSLPSTTSTARHFRSLAGLRRLSLKCWNAIA